LKKFWLNQKSIYLYASPGNNPDENLKTIKMLQHFKLWQLQHYAERLEVERQKQNWKAVSFLRNTLKQLQCQ